MDYFGGIQDKIVDDANLNAFLQRIKETHQRIVFTNGCFDLLHRGHIEYLAKAASLGDVLVVGLNTDASVQRLKGPNRPLVDQQSRALLLAALHCVSGVVFFDQDTPYELIKKVKPDILVKGADYKAEDIVGYDVVKAHGGHVVTIELTDGFSTTALVQKIVDAYGQS